MDHPVAIVTGAGRGIGRATAELLAGQGYRVALVSRSEAELNEAAEGMNQALPIPADVTEPEDVRRIIETTLERFGRIDALINCAGQAPVRTLEQMSVDEWRGVIDTNLSAVFYLCQATWPTFRKQRGGVVVNISSLACRDPFPGLGAYGAAKAGLNLLGLALAREGQAIGVRVHTVAPGAVETAMLRSILTTEQFPSEMTMSPQEVARVIAQCVQGDLQYSSGEVIFLHKTV